MELERNVAAQEIWPRKRKLLYSMLKRASRYSYQVRMVEEKREKEGILERENVVISTNRLENT